MPEASSPVLGRQRNPARGKLHGTYEYYVHHEVMNTKEEICLCDADTYEILTNSSNTQNTPKINTNPANTGVYRHRSETIRFSHVVTMAVDPSVIRPGCLPPMTARTLPEMMWRANPVAGLLSAA
ncbi:hypothetical protein CSOJ01_10999 [Colletotrichum sojae]|uniref:Uncharacterized protein n=1 Tax=Colletotrichum sojae TaxID=2175907 RepID=A0A8H6MPA8_9PEZI|nr:hypothetical protein CSOJ01_10999 [Colletotrichum sojae]